MERGAPLGGGCLFRNRPGSSKERATVYNPICHIDHNQWEAKKETGLMIGSFERKRTRSGNATPGAAAINHGPHSSISSRLISTCALDCHPQTYLPALISNDLLAFISLRSFDVGHFLRLRQTPPSAGEERARARRSANNWKMLIRNNKADASHRWMDGRMDQWIDGLMDGWMD